MGRPRAVLTSRWTVFVATLAVFCAMSALFFDHSIDDAFISFRYAENLIAGHGLVFNPGERVEGYTNFLWVILIAPFMAIGADPEMAARMLGILAAAGTLAAVVRFAPRPAAAPGIVWVAPLLLAASPAFGLWATAGMETPLFACLVAWAACLIAWREDGARVPGLSAVLAGLAALTRPEGVGVAALLILAVWIWRLRNGSGLRGWTAWCGIFLAIVLPYFVWRWSYYGYPLPNTFYAKVGSRGAQVLRGIDYMSGFLAASGYALVLPLAGLWWNRRRPALVLLVLAAGLAGYVILVGGDALTMYRFVVPILAPLSLLCALGVEGIAARLPAAGPARSAARVALALAVPAIALLAARPAFTGPEFQRVAWDRRELDAWKRIGGYFREHAPADASLAVLPAGAMPYYSKLRAIDLLGLTDPAIAHREIPAMGEGTAGHEKHDTDRLLSWRPDFIVVGVYGLMPPSASVEEMVEPLYEAERVLLADPRFRRDYRLVRAALPDGDFVYFARDAGL